MKPRQIGVVLLCGVVLTVLACWTPDAGAQRGRGGPRLAPEKVEAAWKLEAGCVAKALGLSEEKTGQLADAYKAARESYQEGIEELSADQGGDRGDRFEAYRRLQDEERGKLEGALKGILKEGQVAQAIASLGTFSRSWDRYVDTLAGMELGDEKLTNALVLVNQYVIDSDKATREALANQDWESMREVRRSQKEKLDTALAAVLSEEQLTKWSEATASRGRGG